MSKFLILIFMIVNMVGGVVKADPFLNKYKGEVVLVDFWASWCTPCLLSLPWLKDMQRKYHKQGFRVISINIDNNKKQADRFISRFKFDLEVIFDSEKKYYKAMSVESMPTGFLYSRKGSLAYRGSGFDSNKAKSLEEKIVRLLAESYGDTP